MPQWLLWLRRRGWKSRAALLSILVGIALLFLVYLSGLWPRPSAIAAALVASLITLPVFETFRAKFSHIDWRVGAILFATLVSVIASLVTYAIGFGHDPATFFGAVYASWVGGVAFFTFVGVVVAGVSLAKPEEEPFESRVRILLRRKTGLHIDYIVERMNQVLEQYVERVAKFISVREYDPSENKYRVVINTVAVLRAYVEDVKTTHDFFLGYSGVTAAPAGKVPNRLLFVRVDGQTKASLEPLSETGFRREFKTILEPESSCEIEHEIEVWMHAATEELTYTPIRYTQKVNLIVENRLDPGAELQVKVIDVKSSESQQISLRPGDKKPIGPGWSEIRPDTMVYDVRILPP